MREIKFRARRIDTGKWVYGDYFKSPLTDENSGTKPDAGWFFLTGEKRHCISDNGVVYIVDKDTLGEFTGLHDKNGKEIWEGDIIQECEVGEVIWGGEGTVKKCPIGVVDWGYSGWGVHQDVKGIVDMKDGTQSEINLSKYDGQFQWDGTEIEVLGNIYENSELLDSKQKGE